MDPADEWTKELDASDKSAAAPLYQDFRECVGIAGQDPAMLPVPAPFKGMIADDKEGFFEMFRFYRACAAKDVPVAGRECKNLVTDYLGDYLNPDADWDALCRDWCSAFLSPRSDSCDQAFSRYGADSFRTPGPLLTLCREDAALDPADCSGLDQAKACLYRSELVVAVRTSDMKACAGTDWRCHAAASGNPLACSAEFGPKVAEAICAARQETKPAEVMPVLAISTMPAVLKGTVLDSEGFPLPSIFVDVRLSSAPGTPACEYAVTDLEGRYRIGWNHPHECGFQSVASSQTVYLNLRVPGYFTLGKKPVVLTLTEGKGARDASWGPGLANGAPKLINHAGAFCAETVLDGRPLPAGMVTLVPDTAAWAGGDEFGGSLPKPGLAERSLVRLHDGSFCLRDLAPGNYLLNVLPPQVEGPLPMRIAGLSGMLLDYRLTLSEEGKLKLYDHRGIGVGPDPAAPFRLEYVAAPPATGIPLDVDIAMADGSAVDLKGAPSLFFAGAFSSTLARWVPAGPPAAHLRFTAQAPKSVVRFFVWSDWAVSDLTVKSERGLAQTPGNRYAVYIRLARGSRLSGSVRLPDGGVFIPHAAEGPRPGSSFKLRLWGVRNNPDHVPAVFADSEGRYDFGAVTPGPHQWEALGDGNGFQWASGVTRGIWISSTSPTSEDVTLQPGGHLSIAVPASASLSTSTPIIVGVPAQQELAEKSWTLWLQRPSPETPVFLVQGMDGRWQEGRRPAESLLYPIGNYTFHLMLVRNWAGLFPSFQELDSVVEGLKMDTTAPVSFHGISLSGGAGGLQGLIRARKLPTLDDVMGSSNWREGLARLIPRLDLFDPSGRYAATVFSDPSQVPALVEALTRSDPAEFERAWADSSLRYEVNGLNPGSYRARFTVSGYQAKTVDVVVKGGEQTSLDIDMDGP